MNFHKDFFDGLWSGEKSICFFVFQGRRVWVVDEKYNFCLDAEKDYQAYFDKRYINQEQFSLACREFRGGLIKLTAENFLGYLNLKESKVLSSRNLAEIF